LGDQGRLDEEAVEQLCDIDGSSRWRNTEDNDAGVMLGRIVPDIGKIEIAGHQTLVLSLRMICDLTVVRMPRPDVPYIHGIIAMATHDVCGRRGKSASTKNVMPETGRRGKGWN
jgi:hypothetical protein